MSEIFDIRIAREEISRLTTELEQYKRWHAAGRSNVEYTATGVRICRGHHEGCEPCEWEEFTRESA
jgi:hypothetical protein